MNRRNWLIVTTALVLTITACGGDDAGVEIDGAWARTSPSMADAGAIYMQISSGVSDRLIGASVDDSIAGRTEIHETVMAEMGDDSSSDDSMGGAMMMQEVGEIDLAAGESVSLEPGGLHIMLLGLIEPLELGDTFEVTLQFETAGDMTVEVEVRDDAP